MTNSSKSINCNGTPLRARPMLAGFYVLDDADSATVDISQKVERFSLLSDVSSVAGNLLCDLTKRASTSSDDPLRYIVS